MLHRITLIHADRLKVFIRTMAAHELLIVTLFMNAKTKPHKHNMYSSVMHGGSSAGLEAADTYYRLEKATMLHQLNKKPALCVSVKRKTERFIVCDLG